MYNDTVQAEEDIMKKLINWLSESRRLSQTEKELMALTDRELADIGIRRCDIRSVVRDRA